MAELSGRQLERLQSALLAAFDRSELEQLVRIDLEENLEAIAGSGKLRVVAFELITWAQRTGRVGDLLAAAQTRRPRNTDFAALAQELGGVAPTAGPATSSSAPGRVGTNTIEAGNVSLGGTQLIDQHGATFHIGARTEINTGGGAYVGGGVDTGGGAFVGRDATTNTPPPASIDAPLLKLAASVALNVSAAKVDQALAQVTAIQTELANSPDDERLAGLVQTLAGLAPAASSAVVAAFTDPVLGTRIGPVTRDVVKQLGDG